MDSPEHKIGKQLLWDVSSALNAESTGEGGKTFRERMESAGLDLQGFMDFAEEYWRRNHLVILEHADPHTIFVTTTGWALELGVAAEKRRQMEKMVDG